MLAAAQQGEQQRQQCALEELDRDHQVETFLDHGNRVEVERLRRRLNPHAAVGRALSDRRRHGQVRIVSFTLIAVDGLRLYAQRTQQLVIQQNPAYPTHAGG